MTTNPVKSIRIGTIVWGGQPVEAIRYLLPHGFESFQISLPEGDAKKHRELASRIEEAIGGEDAVISALGVYGNPLERDTDIQRWESAIDAARIFGTDIVSGFAGCLQGQSVEAAIPRFKEVFEPLAKRAQDNGVRIAFENCSGNGTVNNADSNIAQHPECWERMFDAVPCDNLGLEWEPCHQMIRLIDPMPQLCKWVGKIFHIHGKDATVHWHVVREHGVNGSKPYAFHRTPGFGDSNWTDIISELRRAGFVGCIDIEGLHDPIYRGALEITGQVHALNYLKQCRGGEFAPNSSVVDPFFR